ncbi:MAG: phenylacetate--CoA ligase family protein [Gammaproteobacteria bacterium]|nr:phenylacetate--CoA ligase family protein [Gammaproteobacteria bacterium]
MTPPWHIRSAINGIAWPALPAANAAGRLATLFQLEQSQWWPQERLWQHQLQQAQLLLRHSVAHVPWYRERLPAAAVGTTPLDAETWHSLPILSRNEVQQAGDSLRAVSIPPGHGRLLKQRTSGSTGKPIETFSTELSLFFWNTFTLREHLWHKRDLSGKLAVIRYSNSDAAQPPHGQKSNNWGRATQGVIDTGESCLLSIFTTVPEQAEWLAKENPDYLLTHPSVMRDVARYCKEHGIKLPALREARSLGEALPDGLREICHDAWGVEVTDVYSTTELGYLAFQCPEHEHYHIQSESAIVEILDNEGQPCQPGEVGRVIVTPLHNYATPLIRYEVGDYAELGEPCSCGRGLPVIRHIQGRYRNLVTLPSGTLRYPRLGIQDLYEIAPIDQFQAIQHSLESIELKVVVPRPLSESERTALLRHFSQAIGNEFHYTLNEVDALHRSPGGKYEEFISAIQR